MNEEACTPSATNECLACGNRAFVDRKLKRYCTHCGQLCETCCDGGEINAPHGHP